MTRTVDLAEQARDEIDAIRRWQTQPGSGAAAKRRVRGILAAIGRLREHPCRHRAGNHAGTRQLVVGRHVVIYQVTPDTGRDETAGDVLVPRVFGPGQTRDTL